MVFISDFISKFYYYFIAFFPVSKMFDDRYLPLMHANRQQDKVLLDICRIWTFTYMLWLRILRPINLLTMPFSR